MPFINGPYSFTPGSIKNNAPIAGGVYGIDGGRTKMTYVGQSESIQRRLQELYGDKKHCIWEHDPVVFYFERVYGDEGARRRCEEQLIAQYTPPCNKA